MHGEQPADARGRKKWFEAGILVFMRLVDLGGALRYHWFTHPNPQTSTMYIVDR
jgi:hypothetical protein